MTTQTLPTVTVTLAHNQVKATKHLVSTSGLFIPANSTGRILEYCSDGSLIVDFGYLLVFRIPAGSPLVEFVNGGGK